MHDWSNAVLYMTRQLQCCAWIGHRQWRLAAACACLRVQEFLQALYIIADECGMELVDAAVQLGADPAHLQGASASALLCLV